MSVFQRFRETRIALGFSQNQFASELNVYQRDISKMENGTVKNIPQEVMQIINARFNINTNWLLTGSGDMFLKADSGDTVIHGGNNIITETAKKVIGTVNYARSNSQLAQKVSELENVIENLQKEKELIVADNQRLEKHIERLEKLLDKE